MGKNGEFIGHLLILCDFPCGVSWARMGSSWTTCSFFVIFCIIYHHWCFVCLEFNGLCHKRVVDLLAWWKGAFHRHRSVDIYNVILLCIIWTIWRVWKNTFEGVE